MTKMKRNLWLAAMLVAVLPAAHARSTAKVEAGEGAAAPLERLEAGNARFVAGKPLHGNQSSEWRRSLTAGQHPFATVLACSDSRVPVELVFDQGFGDLFVVRVAGNVAATADVASILYAAHHLHTPLVFVLGHEGCGAVTAALGTAEERSHEAREIQELLSEILPALTGIDRSLPAAERVHRGVEANVRLTVKRLRDNPELRESHEGAAPKIVGGVYDLETGKVRLLD